MVFYSYGNQDTSEINGAIKQLVGVSVLHRTGELLSWLPHILTLTYQYTLFVYCKKERDQKGGWVTDLYAIGHLVSRF